MGERVVEWSDLPRELLPMIGKSLDARVDVLRFRSVCTSWRSSIPPFHSPRFPLKIPEPRTRFEVAALLGPPAYLCESTLYLVQPVNTFPTSTSSSSCNKGWLIKVEESNSGKLRLLDPLPNLKYFSTPLNSNDLNLLNFRVVELRKAYTLGFQVGFIPNNYHPIPWVTKVVMLPSSDGPAAFVVFTEGQLGFAKCGDKKWTLVNDGSSEYDDIIVYKGQLYVVDTLGIVWWVKCSSLELVQFSPPLCGLGHQKHLVESCGALYVVDRYLDRERRRIVNNIWLPDFPKTVDFKVYKLDEEEWTGWVLLKSLGDRAFVLGTDCCFSVSAQEFVGCKGNCIYFIDQHESQVFSLEDHSIGDLAYSLCEAPTWLSSANPLPLIYFLIWDGTLTTSCLIACNLENFINKGLQGHLFLSLDASTIRPAA